MRRMTGLALLGLCLTLGTPAGTAIAGDSNHNGNGWNNRNAISIRSPTTNQGLQSTSNSNAGGVTSTRHGFCKKVHFCKIKQQGFVGFN